MRALFAALVAVAALSACSSKKPSEARLVAAADSISGTINVTPELSARIPANAVLYVFAKAVKGGGGPPLAVQRMNVTTFPIPFSLSGADSFAPGVALGGHVFVTARVSLSGNAPAQPGDLEGVTPAAVAVGTHGVAITIDTIR